MPLDSVDLFCRTGLSPADSQVIAALIFFKTGIPVAYSFYTLNIILLSIAYRIVGRGFVLKTIYGASGLSLFMLIAQIVFQVTSGLS